MSQPDGAVPVIEDRGDEFTPDTVAGSEVVTFNDAEMDGDILGSIAAEEGVVDDTGTTDGVDDAANTDTSTDVDSTNTDAGAQATIPKARFDQVNSKANALQEENDRLRSEADALKNANPDKDTDDTAAPENATPRDALNKLRDERKEALTDGDMEEYGRLSEEIEEEGIRVARAEFQQSVDDAAVKNAAALEVNTVVTEALKDYPFLKDGGPDSDPDAIVSVRNRSWELQESGVSPAEALKQAVSEKGPKFAKINGMPAPANRGNADAATIKADRAAAARTKAAGATLQPGALGSSEDESFTVDLATVTDKEYAKIPEGVKARARGDYFE